MIVNFGLEPEKEGNISRIRIAVSPAQVPGSCSKKLVFGEELANQLLFLFVPDPREQLCAEPGNRCRFVEGQLVINLPALEMTWLATRLEDWPNLLIEVMLHRHRDRGRLVSACAAGVEVKTEKCGQADKPKR